MLAVSPAQPCPFPPTAGQAVNQNEQSSASGLKVA
jgi:hypothetical protein